MNKQYSHYWLVALVCLTMSVYGGSSSYAQETETEEDATPALETELDKMATSAQETELKEEDAVPVESETVFELEREVHFRTPKGEDVTVSPGIYAVESAEGGLALIPGEEGQSAAVIIDAQPTTHEESVKAPQPVSVSGEEDQHVVMLLLPDGKAMQAVGSYSGVYSRHQQPSIKFRPGSFSGHPKITSILAIPPRSSRGKINPLLPPGHITPLGILYIKGRNFMAHRGNVFLQVEVPVTKNFYVTKQRTFRGTKAGTKKIDLKVEKWSHTRIKVLIPPMAGVPDHSAILQVKTVTGKPSFGRKVPFYALRGGKPFTLKFGEAVTSVLCGKGGENGSNVEGCVHQVRRKPASACTEGGPLAVIRKDKTISAYHVNCDVVFDWDKGWDKYTIELKKGWVIFAMRRDFKRSSDHEYVGLLKSKALTKKYKGASKTTIKVPWQVSPNDELNYWIDIDVQGPLGVPY